MATVKSYRVILLHKSVEYEAGSCWTMAQLRLTFTDDNGAWLIFYDAEKTPKVPAADTTKENATVFIPKDQYAWHLDLLRNEHPVHYVNEGGSIWQGSLRTTAEGIGEGE